MKNEEVEKGSGKGDVHTHTHTHTHIYLYEIYLRKLADIIVELWGLTEFPTLNSVACSKLRQELLSESKVQNLYGKLVDKKPR